MRKPTQACPADVHTLICIHAGIDFQPSFVGSKTYNRALYRLHQNGYIEKGARGIWKVTVKGQNKLWSIMCDFFPSEVKPMNIPKMYRVSVVERHVQEYLVKADNPEEARERAFENDAICIEGGFWILDVESDPYSIDLLSPEEVEYLQATGDLDE